MLHKKEIYLKLSHLTQNTNNTFNVYVYARMRMHVLRSSYTFIAIYVPLSSFVSLTALIFGRNDNYARAITITTETCFRFVTEIINTEIIGIVSN